MKWKEIKINQAKATEHFPSLDEQKEENSQNGGRFFCSRLFPHPKKGTRKQKTSRNRFLVCCAHFSRVRAHAAAAHTTDREGKSENDRKLRKWLIYNARWWNVVMMGSGSEMLHIFFVLFNPRILETGDLIPSSRSAGERFGRNETEEF